MTARRIVPVDPASGSGEVVLVEVLHQGDHPLDLRLVACEGENPYIAMLQHRDLGKLKHKFKGTDEAWAALLSYFLLQQQPKQGFGDVLQGCRIVYIIRTSSLELSIRQDVQGIKVVLGEITLKQDDEFELNPFEWAQVAATAHHQSLADIADLRAQLNKLEAQMKDFIETKNESEKVMLHQFMQLLNEKKRKIRDQNRLLAGAKMDQVAASNIKVTRAERDRKPSASRASKRKAPARAADPDPAPHLDKDQMEIDEAKVEEQEDGQISEPDTPNRSDEETDVEDEELELPTRSRSSRTASLAPATETEKQNTESKGAPPPRSLPFSKSNLATRSRDASQKPLPSPVADEDETDEEL